MSDTAARDINSTRHFAVPREVLFDAFTNPDCLRHWWGPNGFTNTVDAFDPVPGGAFNITMHGPDGTNYVNESVFDEVSRPERIVFTHLEPRHHFRMEMTFAEAPGGTHLTWRMTFDTAAEVAPLRDFLLAANEQNFDRLAAQVSRTPLPPT